MGARTFTTTKDYIEQAALPDYGPASKYAIIPHKEVIEAAATLLQQASLVPDVTLYKANQNADVVRAVYHLGGSDPDMEMMFAWVNSYDKSKRFQTCVGALLRTGGGYWLGGNMGNYTRKHTGNAKQEAIDAMSIQIANAGAYFNSMISHKEEMKLVILPVKLRAELLGRILYEKGFITMEQASIIKTELMQPKDYNADKDSLWALMSHINLSLNKSHPREWMQRCMSVSDFLVKEFNIGTSSSGDPKQTNLITAIAEIEAEQAAKENDSPTISFEL